MNALRQAYEVYYQPLVRLSVNLVGRLEVAEDIVQEAFVRSASRLASLSVDEVGPYLRKVVPNMWKNRLRGFLTERRIRERLSIASTPPDSEIEERLSIWPVVVRLPRRQRACIVLRYYEDLSERAAAEILGCSVGTVKSHTSRALKKIRKELTDGP